MRSIASISQLVAVCVASLPMLAAPSRTLAQVAVSPFEGRPNFKEGKAFGYFVWHEGDTWKLRWMTFESEHKFAGRVAVAGGEIASFKRIDVDTEREIVRPGRAGKVVRGPRGRVVAGRPGRGLL